MVSRNSGSSVGQNTSTERATGQNTSIRLVGLGDAEAITEHLVRDKQAAARWTPARPDVFYTSDGQRTRIERCLAAYAAGTMWPGVVLADGVVIGQLTVNSIEGEPFRKGSLGYWIAGSEQNRGHAGGAVALLMEVMRDELNLHRAEASTQMENTPSQRVLRRNGFTSYGIAHSHIFIEGAWRDGVLWERTLE